MLNIHSIKGSDIAPVEISSVTGRRRLESYVWPDMVPRYKVLNAALSLAASASLPPVEAMDARAFFERELQAWQQNSSLSDSDSDEVVVTVFSHSWVWNYLPPADQASITALMNEASAKATPSHPLAWLRMEDAASKNVDTEIRLSLWTGGDNVVDHLIASSHPHAVWIVPVSVPFLKVAEST